MNRLFPPFNTKKTGLFILFLFINLFIFAQETTDKVEMADALRKDGKIWVVVASLGIILSCLLVYLFILGRKLNKMERNMKTNFNQNILENKLK